MLIETETSPDHHVRDVRRGRAAGDLLILGLYNKLVKQHGSDFTDTRA